VFKGKLAASKEALDLISKVLVYDPAKRITPLEALTHTFFDDIRREDCLAAYSGSVKELPKDLFNFS
jgi:serine/threonine protein kinase